MLRRVKKRTDLFIVMNVSMKKTSRSIESHHRNYFIQKYFIRFLSFITLSQIKLHLIYNFSLRCINTRLTQIILFFTRTIQLVQFLARKIYFIHSLSLSLYIYKFHETRINTILISSIKFHFPQKRRIERRIATIWSGAYVNSITSGECECPKFSVLFYLLWHKNLSYRGPC